MPRRETEPVERIHVLLYTRDIQALRAHFGKRPGVAPAVRAIVRQFMKRLDTRLEEVIQEAEAMEGESSGN